MALVKTSKIEDVPENALAPILAAPGAERFVICRSPEKLKNLLNALQEGHCTHYVSDGDWSMIDLVLELLKKYKHAELWITTYSLREHSVRQLIAAQERKEILSINMLVDHRAKSQTPEVYHLANLNMNRIHLTSIHAKVCVMKCAGGSVTVVGSANWTNNPRIEAGVVSLDPAVAEFHISWIQKAMDNAELFS
ncbi:MAG TPA: phospholipase D-like domain-containing protein [Chitinophagaceae bacterium]|nr:phospholipase D-like domain-containing protein [Chitinophagaceae bacterium]